MKMQPLDLVVERLGPLPLVNHLLERLGVEALLERFVPTTNARCRLPYAKALGVLLRSILTEREPIYRQQEVVDAFAPAAFGLSAEQARHLQDDQIGRALDRLFDADRGSLLTALVVAAGEAFDLDFGELHNDSTTVRFAGQYAAARGRSVRGRKAPFITYGYSKDHRPDLKQLLFILSTTRDGGVPVQFRCEAGNHSDSRTHEETWQTLVRVAGRTDFLYVADSKLCNGEAMEFIDRRAGRFLTVLPRSRLEDREFREWIQTHEPDWEKVLDRRNPRRKHGPRDRWFVFRHLPSQEGWPVTWIFSPLLKLRQQQSRRDRIARAEQRLDALARHLRGPRPRRRPRHELQAQVDAILRQARVRRYIKVTVEQELEHVYRQERPGRPGPDTR